MKMEIMDQKKNPLMAREELKVKFEYHGDPTIQREEVVKKIADKTGANEELVILDRMKTASGKGESIAEVFIYKKKEEVPKYLLDKMIKRKKKVAAEGDAAADSGKPESKADSKEKKG